MEMRNLVAFIAAGFFLIMIIGVYIKNTFPTPILYIYFLMIFGMLVTMFWLFITNRFKGNKPSKAKIITIRK